jgi:predicted RNA-binding protein YlqC (UPF0109 family)
MTTATETISDLLRDLATAFIDHPEKLDVSFKEFPGACNWSMRGHADDQPKLVGKRGAHIQALAFIVKALGLTNDSLYKLKLLEPEPDARRDASPPRLASDYDPRAMRDLLCRVLENLGIGEFKVEAVTSPGMPIAVLFNIHTRTAEDYTALTVAPEVGGLTVVGALGTLFRAHANKVGVRINLEVLRP